MGRVLEQDGEPANAALARRVLSLLRPHRVSGARKVRLGKANDGGYVMLDAFEGVTAAYSIGIERDVSWDLEMAARGVPVRQYDHTIDALPEENPLFRWRRKGLGAVADPPADLQTLPEMLAENGDDGSDLILKCDCEGAEWDVLPALPPGVLARFRQIVLEIHWLGELADAPFAARAEAALAALTADHRVVHVHGNNWSPWAVVGGVAVPHVLELTLARIDLGEFTPSDERFPTALDQPCKPGCADLYLGAFDYG